MRQLLVLIIALVLTGCDSGPDPVDIERRARLVAQRQAAEASQAAKLERSRREFWQSAAHGAAVMAVILFIFGTSLGSRSRRNARSEQP